MFFLEWEQNNKTLKNITPYPFPPTLSGRANKDRFCGFPKYHVCNRMRIQSSNNSLRIRYALVNTAR